MIAEEILEAALKEIGLPYAEEKYYGSADKYIVWNEANFSHYKHADNEALLDRTAYQIHYFCPKFEDDSTSVRKVIIKQLKQVGFHVSSSHKESEDKIRHVIIDAHIITNTEEKI